MFTLFVNTQKRSSQVTLTHEPNSSFVFTLTKENVKTRKEDKIHYNLGQNMLMHQPTKHICLRKISVFLSSCQKWKPLPNECSISSLPFYCPMLFRITQESYTMVFGPKQHWIGVGGGGVGRVSSFFCLEEMEVWHKS